MHSQHPIEHVCALFTLVIETQGNITLDAAFINVTPEACKLDGHTIYHDSIQIISDHRNFLRSTLPADKYNRYSSDLDNLLHTLYTLPANTNIVNFHNAIKPIHIDRLLNSLDALPSTNPQSQPHEIDAATLNDYKTSITSLIDDIQKDTSLPPEIQTFILRSLRTIHDALHRVTIFGTQPLHNTLESTIGGMLLRQPTLTKLDNPNLRKFATTVLNLCTIANAGSVLYNISTSIKALLT